MLELLGGLSVVTDLGTGAPMEESLKRCVVATRLARTIGCADIEVSDVIYTSLLQHLGCTAYAHESAQVWGDDVSATRVAFLTNWADPRDIWHTWVSELAESTGRSKVRALGTTLAAARGVNTDGPVATCEVARDASRQLGLPESVQTSLFHVLAMWNGKGHPAISGPALPLSTRVMHVASTAVMFAPHSNSEVVTQVQRRAGSYLDPDLVDVFASNAGDLLSGIDDIDPYTYVLDAEPDPARFVDDDDLETVARTFGQLVDLKSPWLHGHSAGVADLAAAAVLNLRLDEHVHAVRLAGYLHDLGRVGVSSRIWDKPGPLSQTERDQARLHAYYSERILSRIPALTQVAKLAGQHHERSDGSGYHHGATASQLTMPSRVLATADAYRSLIEGRPYRAALPTTQAADRLKAEARAGSLDGDAVAAVLQAAGLRSGIRRPRPVDLTQRQVEVLRLVAAGNSNRDIAKRLVISSRTAEHHVQDIYGKIGVSTRAGAALFAMEHGLLDKPG